MAGRKFLKQVGGVLTEEAAIQTSAGNPSAGAIPALDANGLLSQSMMPVGVAPESQVISTSESLGAGDFVNIWTGGVRKADASVAGKEANGFVNQAYTHPAAATVYYPSQANANLTALTPGARYWLSAVTPGGVDVAAPTGSGNSVQSLGRAASATTIVFDPSDPIVLA